MRHPIFTAIVCIFVVGCARPNPLYGGSNETESDSEIAADTDLAFGTGGDGVGTSSALPPRADSADEAGGSGGGESETGNASTDDEETSTDTSAGPSDSSDSGGVSSPYADCHDDRGMILCDGSCVLGELDDSSACAPSCDGGCPAAGACLSEIADQTVAPVCILPCADDGDCDSGLCQPLVDLTEDGAPIWACVWT